jgi:minor tail protein
MAGEATIGALRVVLGADTAKFEDTLKSAASSLQKWGSDVSKIAAGVGIGEAFAKAFATVVSSVEHAIDVGDKLAKSSDKFGIPVETLSALSNAAALSDISLEQLGASLSRLSKNMVAAQAPTSEQAAAFQALHISVTDASGQLKSANDILLAVADSFSKFRDGTTKTALAVAIFGRAGADMIPLLNQGAEGLNKLTGQMRDLGLVIDEKTAKSAEAFNDDLKILAQAKDAIILRILGSSGMLVAMDQLAKRMTLVAGDTAKLADIGQTLGDTLKYATASVAALTAAWELATVPTRVFAEALADIAQGKFVEAWHALTGGVDKAGGAISHFGEAVTSVVPTASEGIVGAANAMAKLNEENKKAAPPIYDPEALKKLKAFNDELNKMSMAGLDASGIFADRLAPGFLALTANMDALKGQVKLLGDGMVQLGPRAEKLNQALLQLEGQKIIEQSLPAWQQFQDQVVRNTTALQALGFTSEQIAAINERAAERAGVSWKNATQDILTNAAAGFAAFAQKNKEFAGIAKGLAIAEAIFNTYLAATKALASYPPPFGEIAAAAAVVAGLGMVAKISAQQFAKGGSFMVPGGMSGVDNQLVPLALSSGERVDITPAGQARSGGRATEITLRGLGPRDLFTGANLRDLIEALNQGARDGYRLKFAER